LNPTTALIAYGAKPGNGNGMQRASIVTNSFWYGLETVADVLIGVASSIAIARVIGPQRLGYFVYLTFLTNVAGRLGAEGVATATRRYMSEYLARGEMGLARSVFFTTLRLQTVLAATVVSIGVAMAWFLVEPNYRLAACLLVLSIAPALVSVVPSQANMAAERFSRNIPSALAGLLAYAIMVTLALTRNWSLAGLASAFLIRRLVETTIRIIPVDAEVTGMLRPPVSGSQVAQPFCPEPCHHRPYTHRLGPLGDYVPEGVLRCASIGVLLGGVQRHRISGVAAQRDRCGGRG
jgi:hypothetical protein